MQQAVGESEVLSILKNVKVLSSLTTKQFITVSRSVTKYEYEENEIIIKQGDDGDTFYMISKGEVSVQINHVEVAILDPGQHFGEMSLLSNEKRSATIVANEDTTCYLLKRSEFVSLLGNLDSIIKSAEEAKKAAENTENSSNNLFSFARNMTRRLATKNSSSNKTFSDSKYADSMFGFDNMHRIKQLGTGTFSTVYLSQHTSGKTYALKVMHKEILISQHQEVCVFREREIMHKLDHPFIAALYATIQDEDSLYLVQQYISGGDFWSFIYSSKYAPSRNGSLKVEHTVFYSSIIISILTYLHDNDIIYRDLKPENIMIESSGYLKLIDFGCAKKMKNTEQLTNTMCGSPEFIAPEVILSKGHNRAVDYWSFGIILYEMLTRSTPFYHDNAAIVYQNIIESKEVLKKLLKNGFDEKSKDLILKLFIENPNMRLGMLRNGIDDILKHPYFGGVDIDRINRRLVVPPYIPNSVDDTFLSLDAIQFDDDFDDSDTIPRYQGKFDFSDF
jgi:tRNA A-37 threonylcarbamoyl transferase component Bud32